MEGTYHFDSSKLKRNKDPNAKSIVLVACGSFNPMTYMHLRMFERGKECMESMGYHVAGGFVSPVGDAYGKAGLLVAHHRVAMCERAVQGSEWIAMDTWEARQTSYTRTLHALDYFASQVGVDIKPVLLCGGDLVVSFNTPGVWKDEDVDELIAKYGLACLERGDTDLSVIIEANGVLAKNVKNIHMFKDVLNDISSTKIRGKIKEGLSVKYLIPDEVIQYIKDNKLYK